MKTKRTKTNKITFTHGKKPKQSFITFDFKYQKDNWIPASKPPKKSGWYIVALKDWSDATKALFGKSDTGFWLLDAYGDITSIVTHWQPFPKPPKQIKTKKGK